MVLHQNMFEYYFFLLSPQRRYVEGFTGKGQTSLAIIYAVSAVFNWLAPSAMALMGLKITLIIGAITYALYIMTFFWLSNALLYSGSALIGVGAALIWTAQV